MAFGTPPFASDNRQTTIKKILHGKIQLPNHSLSADARDLMRSLLRRDVSTRLGGGPGDAEEIKRHRFFSDIDWNMVANRQVSKRSINHSSSFS
jgi:serine/threonine protein kinase